MDESQFNKMLAELNSMFSSLFANKLSTILCLNVLDKVRNGHHEICFYGLKYQHFGIFVFINLRM